MAISFKDLQKLQETGKLEDALDRFIRLRNSTDELKNAKTRPEWEAAGGDTLLWDIHEGSPELLSRKTVIPPSAAHPQPQASGNSFLALAALPLVAARNANRPRIISENERFKKILDEHMGNWENDWKNQHPQPQKESYAENQDQYKKDLYSHNLNYEHARLEKLYGSPDQPNLQSAYQQAEEMYKRELEETAKKNTLRSGDAKKKLATYFGNPETTSLKSNVHLEEAKKRYEDHKKRNEDLQFQKAKKIDSNLSLNKFRKQNSNLLQAQNEQIYNLHRNYAERKLGNLTNLPEYRRALENFRPRNIQQQMEYSRNNRFSLRQRNQEYWQRQKRIWQQKTNRWQELRQQGFRGIWRNYSQTVQNSFRESRILHPIRTIRNFNFKNFLSNLNPITRWANRLRRYERNIRRAIRVAKFVGRIIRSAFNIIRPILQPLFSGMMQGIGSFFSGTSLGVGGTTTIAGGTGAAATTGATALAAEGIAVPVELAGTAAVGGGGTTLGIGIGTFLFFFIFFIIFLAFFLILLWLFLHPNAPVYVQTVCSEEPGQSDDKGLHLVIPTKFGINVQYAGSAAQFDPGTSGLQEKEAVNRRLYNDLCRLFGHVNGRTTNNTFGILFNGIHGDYLPPKAVTVINIYVSTDTDPSAQQILVGKSDCSFDYRILGTTTTNMELFIYKPDKCGAPTDLTSSDFKFEFFLDRNLAKTFFYRLQDQVKKNELTNKEQQTILSDFQSAVYKNGSSLLPNPDCQNAKQGDPQAIECFADMVGDYLTWGGDYHNFDLNNTGGGNVSQCNMKPPDDNGTNLNKLISFMQTTYGINLTGIVSIPRAEDAFNTMCMLFASHTYAGILDSVGNPNKTIEVKDIGPDDAQSCGGQRMSNNLINIYGWCGNLNYANQYLLAHELTHIIQVKHPDLENKFESMVYGSPNNPNRIPEWNCWFDPDQILPPECMADAVAAFVVHKHWRVVIGGVPTDPYNPNGPSDRTFPEYPTDPHYAGNPNKYYDFIKGNIFGSEVTYDY